MHVQTLDSRVLFSCSYTLTDGHLVITGTNAGEDLTILGTTVSNGNPISGPLAPLVEFDPNQLKSITVNARGGNDRIYLESIENYNTVTGKTIVLTVNAEGGNDTIDTRYAEGIMNGGDGNDTIYGGGTLIGGRGNDRLAGTEADGFGGGYSDLIDGGDGNDTIIGNAGRDTLLGGAGNDFIQGFGYLNDTNDDDVVQVNAGSGHDRVEIRAPGTFDLGSGDDRAYVLANDSYEDPSEDPGLYATIRGGDGRDWIQVKQNVRVTPGRAFKLYGDNNDDTIYGSDANDSLYGGAGRDYLFGGAGNDMLEGGSHNDSLIGAQGNDSLYGGYGDDSLVGGPGSDRLYGQFGLDTLVGDASDILVQ